MTQRPLLGAFLNPPALPVVTEYPRPFVAETLFLHHWRCARRVRAKKRLDWIEFDRRRDRNLDSGRAQSILIRVQSQIVPGVMPRYRAC